MTTASTPPPTDEGPAILDAILALPPDADTACRRWRVHDLVAHLTAGAEELADLIERRVDGRPDRPTRPFEPREAPFRALPHDELLTRLVEQNVRMLHALDELGRGGGAIGFTGTTLTAEQIATHVRSEGALHRWDLVGSDDTSERFLAQPELTAHAVRVLDEMSILAESARSIGLRSARAGIGIGSLALVAPDGPAVVLRIGATRTRFELDPDPHVDRVVELSAADRLLALWGRRSADVLVRSPDGTDPTAVLDALLWVDATPWPASPIRVDA